jgi:hypothetical protein
MAVSPIEKRTLRGEEQFPKRYAITKESSTFDSKEGSSNTRKTHGRGSSTG